MRHFVHFLTVVFLAGAATGCSLPDASDFQPKKKETKPPPPVEPPPPVLGFAITTVEPESGSPKGLELIEIRGGGFKNGARVYLGGSEAGDVIISSSSKIYAQTPPHPAGKVTVRVVSIDGSTAALDDGFEYVQPLVVSGVLPEAGPSVGGIPVEIQGKGLSQTHVVLFGGRAALNVVALDDTTVLAVLPENTVGLVDVHVVTSTATLRLRDGFRYVAPPQVTGLSPLTSPTVGGGLLSLTGSGLASSATVSVGSVVAETVAAAPDQSKLVVRIPAGQPGLADIEVNTPDGAVLLEDAFVYLAEGSQFEFALLNIWPRAGPATGGGEVVLVATGLDESPGPWTVRFGDVSATVLGVQPSQNRLMVTAPPGTAGSRVDVTLLGDGFSKMLTQVYQYEETLEVASVTPAEGPVEGGTAVVIRGAGFTTDSVVEVFVGAFSAQNVEVISDTEIHAITAQGSPGYATVRVQVGERGAQKQSGFLYRNGKSEVYAVVPDTGAIAGNTYVTVFGADLPLYSSVTFGGVGGGPHTEQLSPSVIVTRTPRAEAVGPVDINLWSGSGVDITVPEGFTYYDPMAHWGGTWGGPVDGSVNVTVLQNSDHEPIEGAMVMLGHGNPPQYKGYTNELGQVTLSGHGLAGRQEVTAAKGGYSASSVIEFDAANITLFLSGGAADPGEGQGEIEGYLPGSITGTVEGFGKYLVLPPGKCSAMVGLQPPYCTPCTTDADCSGEADSCTTLQEQPGFCSSQCAADTDCPPGFACGASSASFPRCIPSPGRREARCFESNLSIFSADPVIMPDAVVDLESGDNQFALESVRLGEVAIYCVAGLVKSIDGVNVFEPMVMGIARHVVIPAGQLGDKEAGIPSLPPDPVAVALKLNIPLSRSVNVTIEPRPLNPPVGPHRAEARAWLDLGSDGYLPLGVVDLAPDDTNIKFAGLPQSLVGDLYDAQYTFHTSALSETNDTLPNSDVLRTQLGSLDDGPYLQQTQGRWNAIISGYPGDVLDVCTLDETQAFAATQEGRILHYNGFSWWPQSTPAGPPLRAVTRDGQGGVWSVGDEGRILRWDGVAWQVHSSPTQAHLHDVTATTAAGAVAVGHYALIEWDGTSWKSVSVGPPKVLNGVWGRNTGEAWAVGDYGAVLHRPTATSPWTSVTVPFFDHLNAVWSSSNGQVVAVGEGGHALVGTVAGGFASVALPTQRTLYAVWGTGPDNIYAVGDAATVLHFNGKTWAIVHQDKLDVSLRGLDGFEGAGADIIAMGTHAVHLGPFVTVPIFSSPAAESAWQGFAMNWMAEGGAKPTFHLLRVYGSSGALGWTITTPGWIKKFFLPDLGAVDGIFVFPPGPKRLISILGDRVDFSIDDFDGRDFRVMDWRAWAFSTFVFDTQPPL